MENENKEFEIKITKDDKELYYIVKDCLNNDYAKQVLSMAAELYNFCTDPCFDTQYGYRDPETYRDEELVNKTKEELLELKAKCEKEILIYASDFPNECDCGIRVDGHTWFINECASLGYIVLFSSYIKMIDELLNK